MRLFCLAKLFGSIAWKAYRALKPQVMARLSGFYVRISSAEGRVVAFSVCLLGYGGLNHRLSLPKQVLALLDVLK